MKRILFILSFLLIALGCFSQFVRKAGDTIGRQIVIDIPIAAPGYPTAQALIYYPDDYFLPKNANKKYPMFLFSHGAGEGQTYDIAEVTNTSLPYLIKNGLNPYGIDPITGDTIKYIVVSPHAAHTGGSYTSGFLRWTLPYLEANYRIDTNVIFHGGLSQGCRAVASSIMGEYLYDTLFAQKWTGFLPMAGASYDGNLDIYGLTNMSIVLPKGSYVMYIIGDQDQNYNDLGFGAMDAAYRQYCLPGYYVDTVLKNQGHTAVVWNAPFPLNARMFSPTMNVWTQMWVHRRQSITPPLPIKLTNFNVLVINDFTTQVSWETSIEDNVDRFVVERSYDGINWEDVGVVKSKAINGNSSTPIKYTFIDSSVLKNI